LSVATAMIHPIAGLAAVIFTLILLTQKCKVKKWLKNIFYFCSCFGSIIVFWLFKLITGFEISFVNNFNLSNFYFNLFRWSPDLFWFPSITHILKSVAYFLWQPSVIFFVILVFAVIGMCSELTNGTKWSELFGIFSKKFKKVPNSFNSALLHQNKFGTYFITFIILFINSLLLYSFINFPFLIDYERGDFAFRIFTLSVFFLIPLAIIGMLRVINPGLKALQPGLIVILILSAGITTSLYFSYPRQDVYYYERGFNTSQADFNVIEYLENNTNENYVVLANQQIGAGALATYGFRYFKDQYFFYSIPTGGTLYQIYWNVVYSDAGRDEIKKASDLTGAKVVYVYFPKYWFNLDKMKKNLTFQSDDEFEIDGGVVFEFNFSNQ
jgi:hypothetical protein